jgi:hypothetical protein
MGKHEVIKPSSTERVRKHRAEMRAKGYKLKQVWVRDRNDPAYLAEIERANRIINDFEREHPNEFDWMDELIRRARDDLPD